MKTFKEFFTEGLWANINAKKKRGAKSARKGSKAYKAAKKAGDKLEKGKHSDEEVHDEDAESSPDLIQQFRQEAGPSQCNLYDKRDNCGPAALDFISWAESKGIEGLKRIDGYFKADIPVSSKNDFTEEMKQEFLNDGGDWDDAEERFEWLSNSEYAEQWKYIPHYWVEDTNGKIYDPSGQQQFIGAGYAKDINPDRYTLTDTVEHSDEECHCDEDAESSPGRVKRAGASCKGSVTELRKRAKKYGGEKGKMYHWCANMKSGKKKKS